MRQPREEFYTLSEHQMCEIGAGTLDLKDIPAEVFSGESYYEEFKLFVPRGLHGVP